MPSFISSSRVALATAAAVLIGYAAAIELLRPRVTLYPDQNAFNLARAERALIGEGRPRTILVGSSLGARIPDDWLPADWLNLSLGGESAATGLALIEKGTLSPARVVVEINTIDLPADPSFLTEAQGPIPLALRSRIRGLRAEYRPINLLLSGFGALRAGANLPVGPRSLAEACRELSQSGLSDSISQDIVSRQVDSLLTAPVPRDLGPQLADIRSTFARLAGRGAEIVLLEWPVDPALADAAKASAIRRAVRQAFPNLGFVSLSLPSLQTEDGLHLAPISARRAACELTRQLRG